MVTWKLVPARPLGTCSLPPRLLTLRSLQPPCAEAIFSHLNSGLRFSMLTGAIIIALGIVAGAVAGANIGGEKVVHAAHNHHLHHHFSFARRRRSEESELI